MSALNLPEYYADLATTTLSTGYTAASGTMTVTSAAALSTARQFHFNIIDQTTGAVKVIGKATAVSGNTFSITATTDANASSGDIVTIVLCAAAMDQIRADISQFGTFANLPATVPPAGARYKGTDCPYEWISDGTTWQAFWNGLPVTLPSSSGWTSEGIAPESGSAAGTVHYTNGFGYLVGNSYNSQSLGVQYRAAPGSTPYSFTARFSMDASGVIASQVYLNSASTSTISGFAIGWRDSGGKYLVMVFAAFAGNDPFLAVYTFASDTATPSTSGTIFLQSRTLTAEFANKDWCFRIRNDGTNLIFQVSIDGQIFYNLFEEAITTHLSDAASVCWGSLKDGGSAAVCLYDWTQGT